MKFNINFVKTIYSRVSLLIIPKKKERKSWNSSFLAMNNKREIKERNLTRGVI